MLCRLDVQQLTHFNTPGQKYPLIQKGKEEIKRLLIKTVGLSEVSGRALALIAVLHGTDNLLHVSVRLSMF
jgi:hypothetical protein